MAKKIGNQTYPDDIMGVLNDRALGKVFRAYQKARLCDENYLFLDATAKRFDPKKLYLTFIAPGSPKGLNIASADQNAAMTLAAAEDWKNGDWKRVLTAVNEAVLEFLDVELNQSNFWSSPQFRKHHRARAAKKMAGDPAKAAKLLGITDVKATKALMIAHAAGDADEIRDRTASLIKEPELKKKKMKPNMLIQILRKAKFI